MRHKRKFLKNKQGLDKYVVLTVEDNNKILDLLEDLEDIKDFDRITSNNLEFIEAETAFSEIEKARVCL